MAHEPVVTRVEFPGPVPKERTPTDRLVVRFPRFARLALAVGIRVAGPRNPVRRDGLRRVLRSGWAAAARNDWELMLARYSTDVIWEIPEEFQPLGFEPSYHGHQGVVAGLEQFDEAFDWWELLPKHALDFGDRVLTLGIFRARARASGIEMDQPFSQLVSLRRGVVIRDRFFYSWEQGLEAAGLDPDAWAARLAG
jgi:ketosteroid isomerase-like protein